MVVLLILLLLLCVCLLSSPPGFVCWISFAPVFSCMYLLSHYLCLFSFLYHDLYVLGYDVLINKGSFIQTKHLCVLINI